jgi:hypothetical protein
VVILDPNLEGKPTIQRPPEIPVGVNEWVVVAARNFQVDRVVVAAPIAQGEFKSGSDELVCLDQLNVVTDELVEQIQSPPSRDSPRENGLMNNAGDFVEQVFRGDQDDPVRVKVRLYLERLGNERLICN